MGRLRVCQLIGYYDHGGICRVAVELTLRLRKFFEVTLVCRKVLRKPEEDVEIVELGSKNTADLWKKSHKLREQFDIIHTHDVYSLPALVRGKRGAKIVYTDHGIVPIKYQSHIVRSFHGVMFAHLCRFFARQADAVVGISDYIANELKYKVGCRNVIKIPNGVDIERFKPLRPKEEYLKLKIGDPMLLKVGLIEKHKAVDYHIASMPFILKKFPNARLVFIGAGSDINHYKALAKAMKIDRFVFFLGYVPNHMLPLYYNVADIALQVDYWHGFGLPILEAMACGKPVIARDAYGMRELILESGAGVLVKGKDPRELAAAVEQVLNNYKDYSLKARKYAERFDWDKVVTKYMKVYERILKGTLTEIESLLKL
ncbi:MAG: glycosyltransferase family 4 protein [Desulfurococcaceae archaeon]